MDNIGLSWLRATGIAGALALLSAVPSAQGFGVVRTFERITRGEGNFGALSALGRFGTGIAVIGDLDDDGIQDIASGSPLWDEVSANDVGAVWILFMRRDGMVRSHRRIARRTSGFTGDLNEDDLFGSAVASLGDLDGDGIEDMAVGSPGDSEGALWIVFLQTNGRARAQQKISSEEGGLDPDLLPSSAEFGHALASPGDLDGDGVVDLIVGAPGGRLVVVVYLNEDGTVKDTFALPASDLGLETAEVARFGSAVASLGDLDGDGGIDLAVGAHTADNDLLLTAPGAVFILFFDAERRLVRFRRIGSRDQFEGLLASNGRFGDALGHLGDLDRDRRPELAITANTSGGSQQALWVVSLSPDATVTRRLLLDEAVAGHQMRGMMVPLGDLDLDGVDDVIVGSPYESNPDGIVYVLFRCDSLAATDVRNPGGVNPLSYSCTEPSLGSVVHASVDLSTTGHAATTILGYAGALTQALRGGQVLLLDVSHPAGELLQVPLHPGPLATYKLQIPRELALCGLRVSTQALHLFRVQPYALSNAVDLTLGPAGTPP